MKQFNINNRVKVRLTEAAVNELKSQHEKLVGNSGEFRLKTDSEGYTEFQMWVLMKKLGHMFDWWVDSPFEGCIMLFDECDLKGGSDN